MQTQTPMISPIDSSPPNGPLLSQTTNNLYHRITPKPKNAYNHLPCVCNASRLLQDRPLDTHPATNPVVISPITRLRFGSDIYARKLTCSFGLIESMKSVKGTCVWTLSVHRWWGYCFRSLLKAYRSWTERHIFKN